MKPASEAASRSELAGPALKIATFNINDVVRRLPSLLLWLEREKPDVVCLQEIKVEDSRFPAAACAAAGYGAVWRGQKRWHGVAILARSTDPILTRRSLPGDDCDYESRYIEAAVRGVLVGCLYLPNGNPQPSAKFDYKMAWFERHRQLGCRPPCEEWLSRGRRAR